MCLDAGANAGGGGTTGGGAATGGGGAATGGGGGAATGGGGAFDAGVFVPFGPAETDAGIANVNVVAATAAADGTVFFVHKTSVAGARFVLYQLGDSTPVDTLPGTFVRAVVSAPTANAVIWAVNDFNGVAQFRVWKKLVSWSLTGDLANYAVPFDAEPGVQVSTDTAISWWALPMSQTLRRAPSSGTPNSVSPPFAASIQLGSDLDVSNDGTLAVPVLCDRQADGGCGPAAVALWRLDGGTLLLDAPGRGLATAEVSRQRVAISADGKQVARLRYEGFEVFVWRNGAAAPLVIPIDRPLDGGTQNLTRLLALSDDGSTLLIGYPRYSGSTPAGTNVDIRWWNGTSYVLSDTLSEGFILSDGFALSGDGKVLVTTGAFGDFKIRRR